jgi:hypothetical protein
MLNQFFAEKEITGAHILLAIAILSSPSPPFFQVMSLITAANVAMQQKPAM